LSERAILKREMMKTLIALSLLVAVAFGATTHGLGEITTTALTLTVTAGQPDTYTAPVLLTFTYPTTYDSSAGTLGAFAIVGTGTHTLNNTVDGCQVTFTSGSDSVVCFAGAASTDTTFVLSGSCAPKFLVTGSYGASVMCSTALSRNYNLAPTVALAAVAATAYVPPAVTALAIVANSGGCDATGCTDPINATASVTARANLRLTTIFRPTTATTGVKFWTTATASAAGAINYNTDTTSNLAMVVGGVVSGSFSGSQTQFSSDTILVAGNAMPISGQISETFNRFTYFPESTFTGGALQSSATFSGGATTDAVAPTCTVATVAPVTVTTQDVPVPVTLTLTCADTGGSGLWVAGIFANIEGAANTVDLAIDGSVVIPIGPHISATFSIVGVWALDNAGNAALYGSCGSVCGFDTIGCAPCAGGGSSASTVSVSLFAMAVLAFFALLA
jgi:hypothetical protein